MKLLLFLNPWYLLSFFTRGSGLANMLIILSSVLAYVVFWEVTSFKETVSENVVIRAAVLKPLPPPVRFMPARNSDFGSTVEAPLFHSNRKPIVVVVAKKKEKPLGTYKLTGVLITAEKRFALLKDMKSGDEKRVAEGSQHNRWVLEKVHDHSVQLRSGSRVDIVKIMVEKKGANTPSTSRSRTQRYRRR